MFRHAGQGCILPRSELCIDWLATTLAKNEQYGQLTTKGTLKHVSCKNEDKWFLADTSSCALREFCFAENEGATG